MVFRDARALGREPGGTGLLGQIWGTVTVMITLTLFYVSIFSINEIAYLFWFYSGMVASTVVRQKWAMRDAQRARVPTPPRWYAAVDDTVDTAPAR
jgi:hypothetical protein